MAKVKFTGPEVQKPPMTVAARKRHIRTAGADRCPYCKASIADMCDDVEYSEVEPICDGTLEQRAHCLACDREWIDVFKLVDVHELA